MNNLPKKIIEESTYSTDIGDLAVEGIVNESNNEYYSKFFGKYFFDLAFSGMNLESKDIIEDSDYTKISLSAIDRYLNEEQGGFINTKTTFDRSLHFDGDKSISKDCNNKFAIKDVILDNKTLINNIVNFVKDYITKLCNVNNQQNHNIFQMPKINNLNDEKKQRTIRQKINDFLRTKNISQDDVLLLMPYIDEHIISTAFNAAIQINGKDVLNLKDNNQNQNKFVTTAEFKQMLDTIKEQNTSENLKLKYKDVIKNSIAELEIEKLDKKIKSYSKKYKNNTKVTLRETINKYELAIKDCVYKKSQSKTSQEKNKWEQLIEQLNKDKTAIVQKLNDIELNEKEVENMQQKKIALKRWVENKKIAERSDSKSITIDLIKEQITLFNTIGKKVDGIIDKEGDSESALTSITESISDGLHNYAKEKGYEATQNDINSLVINNILSLNQRRMFVVSDDDLKILSRMPIFLINSFNQEVANRFKTNKEVEELIRKYKQILDNIEQSNNSFKRNFLQIIEYLPVDVNKTSLKDQLVNVAKKHNVAVDQDIKDYVSYKTCDCRERNIFNILTCFAPSEEDSEAVKQSKNFFYDEVMSHIDEYNDEMFDGLAYKFINNIKQKVEWQKQAQQKQAQQKQKIGQQKTKIKLKSSIICQKMGEHYGKNLLQTLDSTIESINTHIRPLIDYNKFRKEDLNNIINTIKTTNKFKEADKQSKEKYSLMIKKFIKLCENAEKFYQKIREKCAQEIKTKKAQEANTIKKQIGNKQLKFKLKNTKNSKNIFSKKAGGRKITNKKIKIKIVPRTGNNIKK